MVMWEIPEGFEDACFLILQTSFHSKRILKEFSAI